MTDVRRPSPRLVTMGRAMIANPGLMQRAWHSSTGLSRWRALELSASSAFVDAPRNQVTTRRMRLRHGGHTFYCWVRDTDSDAESFAEIVLEDAYPVGPWLAERSAPTVVDLGANIGIASALFSAYNPEARIVAVEPLVDNITVLLANAHDPSHRPWEIERAAISTSDGSADFHASGWYASGTTLPHIAKIRQGDPQREEFHRIRPPETVRTMSMETLISTHSLERIDLLKMDIEGAEEAVLSGSPAWLAHVMCVAIDVHEAYIDAEAVHMSLERSGLRLQEQRGRTRIYRRKPGRS